MSDLPYPPDEGSTHWDGCYRKRGHHNCAVAMVDQLAPEPPAQPQPDTVIREAQRTVPLRRIARDASQPGPATDHKAHENARRKLGTLMETRREVGALRAEVARLTEERDSARTKSANIHRRAQKQEAANLRERRGLLRDLRYYVRLYADGERYAETAVECDWSPDHPFWNMTSENNRAAISALVAQRDAAEARNATLERWRTRWHQTDDERRVRADKAEAEVVRLREALEWYADPEVWAITNPRDDHRVLGGRAIAALAQPEPPKPACAVCPAPAELEAADGRMLCFEHFDPPALPDPEGPADGEGGP